MPTQEMYRTREFLDEQGLEDVKNALARRREEELSHLDEHKNVSQTLELKGQVALIDRQREQAAKELELASELDPSAYYPEIPKEESIMWREWLPNCRSIEEYGAQKGERLIPEQVLREIGVVKASGVFDKLVVYGYNEGEGGIEEVLLVGEKGKRKFKIARWGERLKAEKDISVWVRKALSWLPVQKSGHDGSLCAVICFSLVFAFVFGVVILLPMVIVSFMGANPPLFHIGLIETIAIGCMVSSLGFSAYADYMCSLKRFR